MVTIDTVCDQFVDMMRSGNRTAGQRKTGRGSSSKNVGRYEPLASDDGEPSSCRDEDEEGTKLGAQSTMETDKGASNTIDDATPECASFKFDESHTVKLKDQKRSDLCRANSFNVG